MVRSDRRTERNEASYGDRARLAGSWFGDCNQGSAPSSVDWQASRWLPYLEGNLVGVVGIAFRCWQRFGDGTQFVVGDALVLLARD